MIHIASPCHEAWNAMTPNGQGRHCAACEKTVVDVAAMPTDQARHFLSQELPLRLAKGEKVCVRAPADRKNRILHPGQRLLTNGMAAILSMTIGGYLGFGPELGAAEPVSTAPVEQPAPLMGAPKAPEPMPMGEAVAPHPRMGRVVCKKPVAKIIDCEKPIAEEPPMMMGDVAINPALNCGIRPQATGVTTIEQLDSTIAVTAEVAEQLSTLLDQADGRWEATMAVPMISPAYVLTRADGRRYQIILKSILTGPDGGIRDEALVATIIATIQTLPQAQL